ncbi:pilin [Nonomuraea sp. NPDC049784]|uniref:pilin n=1 Tax=Nonomuraea sp. NPDC049784 TaxID=3154361 RepID=UPI0033E0195E
MPDAEKGPAHRRRHRRSRHPRHAPGTRSGSLRPGHRHGLLSGRRNQWWKGGGLTEPSDRQSAQRHRRPGGALATLFLTGGGVRYILAGGAPGEAEAAKKTLRYAALGYGIAVLAPLLVSVLKGIVGA